MYELVYNLVSEVFNQWDWNNASRRRIYVEKRQLAHWIMYYYTHEKTGFISHYFGGKNHDLVHFSVRVINDRCETDYELSTAVRSIMMHLQDNGFKVLYPYGRILKKQNQYCFPSKFARKPKNIEQQTKIILALKRQREKEKKCGVL